MKSLFVIALIATVAMGLNDIIPQLHSVTAVLANEHRCIYAMVPSAGERIFFQYQVRSGSNDFGVLVEQPDGQTIFVSENGEHTHEDRIYFQSKMSGEFSFCIDNTGRHRDEKTVRLSVAMNSVKRSKRRADPLYKSMAKAEASLIALSEDQVYLRTRERDHRVTIESNNTRMLIRWLIELTALVGMGFGQVYMLQKLFKKKTERAA